MGVIISRMTKPVKTFNIENHVEKIFKRDKPMPAPTYDSTADQLKIAKQVNPNFMEDHYKKNPQLNERLKQIYVSSHIKQEKGNNENPDKPLPHRRTADDDFDYGYWEPNEVSVGRCHLKTALKFMSDNSTDPKNHNAETIALNYKLDHNDVENILKYYRVFQVINNKPGEKLANVSNIKEEITDK